MAFTDLIERLLFHDECLDTLKPTLVTPTERLLTIRAATVEQLTGQPDLADRAELVRAILFYANDALSEAHTIVQQAPGGIASYLHGIVHRREEDFDNARHWFRSAGELPFFAALQRAGAAHSEDVAKQTTWDPYLFAGLCERHKYGARSSLKVLAELQKAEFRTLLDYTFRAG